MNKIKLSFKKALKIAFVVLTAMIILGIIVGKGKDKTPKQPHSDNTDSNRSVDKSGNRIETIAYDANGDKVENKESTSTSKIIEGIEPVDVYGNFEKREFKVDKEISTDGSFFICTSEDNGISYEVKIYCEKGIRDINMIRLTATRLYPQYNSVEDMKPFLKYGCSIPYDGYDIEKVNAFIDKNYYNNKASIVISGTNFTIFSPTQFMRMIQIEKE